MQRSVLLAEVFVVIELILDTTQWAHFKYNSDIEKFQIFTARKRSCGKVMF